MRLVRLGLFVLALAAATATPAAGDPQAGARKASSCLGCHGIPGWRNAYPAYSVPKLGGQHPEYIVAALKEYKTQQRSHPTMQSVAAVLSDQDMADLAAYFSQLKP